MNSRVCFVCVCLAAMVAVSMAGVAGADTNAQPNLRDITVVKDIRNFVRNHPGVKLNRLIKEEGKARSQSTRYSLGGRVSGDRLVAQDSDNFAYPAKKDVTIQLTYPKDGNNGAIVTYVEISTTQDQNNGNAYVVAGGIGQRFISIILEAQETTTFSYNAQFFGTG